MLQVTRCYKMCIEVGQVRLCVGKIIAGGQMFKTEHVVHAKAQRPALDMVSTEPNNYLYNPVHM